MKSDADVTKVTAQSAPAYRHWRSLSDGLLVTLVIVGPAFLFEELWRGSPLIDQGGITWLYPAIIMAIGFFVGGTVAGRHRRTKGGAFNQGALVAAITMVLIFAADMIRRMVLHQGISIGVIGIWVGACVAALVVTGIGGRYGRRRWVRLDRRRQMDRFL
jgi:O-antigen/teichoic acid export membrane protein